MDICDNIKSLVRSAAAPAANAGSVPDKCDTAFIGHPVGLAWLSASEFWERFCYYGMQSLLVLYLTHYLLQPGHIEQVWGFAPFERLIGWLYPKTTQMALASNTAQLYAALVYVTPLAGGYIADRLIGRTATVSLGATLMVIGTFLLALNSTFLIGLAFLLAGVGCFKANIASQVGALYRVDDPRREAAADRGTDHANHRCRSVDLRTIPPCASPQF